MGRIREASEEVTEAAEEVCSVKIVVLWATQAYRSGVEEDEDAIVAVCISSRRVVGSLPRACWWSSSQIFELHGVRHLPL